MLGGISSGCINHVEAHLAFVVMQRRADVVHAFDALHGLGNKRRIGEIAYPHLVYAELVQLLGGGFGSDASPYLMAGREQFGHQPFALVTVGRGDKNKRIYLLKGNQGAIDRGFSTPQVKCALPFEEHGAHQDQLSLTGSCR